VVSPERPEPAVRRVRAVVSRLLREGTVVARSDGTLHDLFPVVVSVAEGEALRDWVLRERATRTVEVGLGYGISALYICEGLLQNPGQAPHHVAIDPYQATRFSDCGLQLLDEAGVGEMVELHAEDSQISLPRFVDGARTFDFAFIDGNHRFERVFVDLFYLGNLVKPGGIIFLDDYQLPGIARAASFFTSNLGWTTEEISPPDDLHQWAVLRTSAVPDGRSFDHFVDF
jgi:predicted O-methyltransferase YrrM